MEIGKLDGSAFDMFHGPGRPSSKEPKEQEQSPIDLPDFKIGSVVRIMNHDLHGMPQKQAGREGKIIALHTNIQAADVVYSGSITTETIWLTSLELLK